MGNIIIKLISLKKSKNWETWQIKSRNKKEKKHNI